MRPNAKWLRIMFSFLSLDSARAAAISIPTPRAKGGEDTVPTNTPAHTSQLLLSGMPARKGIDTCDFAVKNQYFSVFQRVRFIDPSAGRGGGLWRLDLTKSER